MSLNDMALTAWIDETLIGDTTYILAAAIADQEAAPALRKVMVPLAGTAPKLHWRDLKPPDKLKVITAIAGCAEVEHLVVVRTAAPDRRERPRRKTMVRMLYELNALGVRHVIAESRGRGDDQRDRNLLNTVMRAQHLVDPRLRFDHAVGPSDPVLWISDAVCGAVREQQLGRKTYWQLIEQSVAVHTMTE